MGGRAKLGPRALVLHVRTRALSIWTPLVVDVDRRAMGVPTTDVTRWKTAVPVQLLLVVRKRVIGMGHLKGLGCVHGVVGVPTVITPPRCLVIIPLRGGVVHTGGPLR